MLSKLSASSESSALKDEIEGKIMSLQTQLRSTRERRERLERGEDLPEAGTDSSEPTATESGSVQVGGRAPRGGGMGRGSLGGRMGRGGFGRAGRGRGRVTNATLDTRSKTLLISQPPVGLSDMAAIHFRRYSNYSPPESGMLTFIR